MSRDLLALVRELNMLNDDNLADRVIENNDVQWCLSELQDFLEAEQPASTQPEIVCCQDCVHHEDGYAHWCNKWEHICPDDSEFFCKFGRKKDENTTD